MPQATDELREEWTDSTALEWIRPNFIVEIDGMIRVWYGYAPTQKDMSAVKYLVINHYMAYERN